MKKIMVYLAMLIAALAILNAADEPFRFPAEYRQWKKVSGVLNYEIPGHGKSARIIYANTIAFTAKVQNDGNGEEKALMPSGSIIIKEVYNSIRDIGKREPLIEIMVKRPGDPRAIEGWLFFMKRPGKAPELVTTRMCVKCHDAANEQHPYFDKNGKGIFRDYLFAPIAK